jgi:hypothetical protein
VQERDLLVLVAAHAAQDVVQDGDGVVDELNGPLLSMTHSARSLIAASVISARVGRVGAENPVMSRDLHVLVYEAAESTSSQWMDGRAGARGSATSGRVLSE